MAREFSRSQRIAEQIKRELASLIYSEIKDHRLGMVTILDVNISKDLSNANVYVSVMQEELIDISLEILNHTTGMLRGLLGKRMHMRFIPHLVFHYDNTASKAQEIDALIAKALYQDKLKKPQE